MNLDLIDALDADDLAKLAERLRPYLAPDDSEPWVGVRDAAAHLACKPQRIYDLVSAKAIPHRHEGTRVLFRLSDLDRWLQDGE